eukprot:6260114-Amphidinium_carterae.1
MPLLAEPLKYRFGGEERDETTRRVKLTFDLANSEVSVVFSVLSGVACHLPGLIGRETMESKNWTLRC